MRSLPFQHLLVAALLAWRVRRLEVSRAWEHLILGVGLCCAALAVPHTIWGWKVQEHVPLAFLRVEGAISAAWFFFGFSTGLGLWIWQALPLRLARKVRLEPVDPVRRRLLAGAPLALAVSVPPGVAGAQQPPQPYPVRVACPNLPPGFEGLRILQVSDLHLGPCLGLDWLDGALSRAADQRVDLVAVTGDLSDDSDLTPRALARIAAVPAPLGHVIIPGNHEYYAGIHAFLRAVLASPVRYLNGEVLPLERNGDRIQLLGIDWPRGRPRKQVQYARMLDAVLEKASPGFKLLLAHDPDAFDQAAPRGIDFQLSGHTHGGQIAPFGVSPLAGWWLKYPMGQYARGHSRMFVTRGLGHWFPFRIDCPTELPIVELVRG